MRKISLDVDALQVESFETAERDEEKRGTVRAHFTRQWEQSCYESCTNIYDCLCASEVGNCINLSDGDCGSNGCTETQYVQFC